MWYLRKPVSAQELAAQSLRAETQRSLTLHQALKQLTNSYLICKECHDNGNYPKVFQPEEFSPMTLRTLLQPNSKPATGEEAGANAADEQAEEEKKQAPEEDMMVTID